MTNSEIVEQIFNTYKIKSMIKKLIKNSVNDDSFKDMEQIIYCQLLIMDNEKLNHLYKTDNLKRWINQIIKNQRNYYKNDYQTSRLKDYEELKDYEYETFNHNVMLDWLDDELNKYNWDGEMNREDIIMAGNYEIMKFYLSTGYSMKYIAKLFNCSATKVNVMILEAKNNIKESYDNDFENWAEKNAINYDGI